MTLFLNYIIVLILYLFNYLVVLFYLRACFANGVKGFSCGKRSSFLGNGEGGEGGLEGGGWDSERK